MLNIWRIFDKKKKEEFVQVNYNVNIKDYNNFIYEWNIKNPIDRWWREKHNIAFNSPEHRVSSFIDMYFEYKEDRIYNDLLIKDKSEKYNPEKGNFLKEQEGNGFGDATDEQLMKFFSGKK